MSNIHDEGGNRERLTETEAEIEESSWGGSGSNWKRTLI